MSDLIRDMAAICNDPAADADEKRMALATIVEAIRGWTLEQIARYISNHKIVAMMKYKGYCGEIEVDEDAGILHGDVIGIRDVITFQGETVREARAAFEASVDDYLALCAELGREPEGNDLTDDADDDADADDYSGHPPAPRELAGKWVAWSRDRRVLVSGDTLAGVMANVKTAGITDASYERLPKLRRYGTDPPRDWERDWDARYAYCGGAPSLGDMLVMGDISRETYDKAKAQLAAGPPPDLAERWAERRAARKAAGPPESRPTPPEDHPRA